MNQQSDLMIRECAQSAIAAIAAHRDDTPALGAALHAAMKPLLTRNDLPSLGIPRIANHLPGSFYLYYDTRMSILLYEVPEGVVVAPHDHGIWETLFVWRGKFHHTVYARGDDGSVAGRASLRVLDDRDLAPGDFAIVAPPDDIHGFRAVEPGSWGITIVDGAYKDARHYYDPAAGTYTIKQQRNAR